MTTMPQSIPDNNEAKRGNRLKRIGKSISKNIGRGSSNVSNETSTTLVGFGKDYEPKTVKLTFKTMPHVRAMELIEAEEAKTEQNEDIMNILKKVSSERETNQKQMQRTKDEGGQVRNFRPPRNHRNAQTNQRRGKEHATSTPTNQGLVNLLEKNANSNDGATERCLSVAGKSTTSARSTNEQSSVYHKLMNGNLDRDSSRNLLTNLKTQAKTRSKPKMADRRKFYAQTKQRREGYSDRLLNISRSQRSLTDYSLSQRSITDHEVGDVIEDLSNNFDAFATDFGEGSAKPKPETEEKKEHLEVQEELDIPPPAFRRSQSLPIEELRF